MNEGLQSDSKVHSIMQDEVKRLNTTLNMIPSENFCTKSVLAACGSVMNNKYAEGYPNKRYYQGNEFIDKMETLAIERAKKLFGAEHANVQPDSGSIANNAVYFGLLKPKDKIMGLRLDMGGHLTHGHAVSASARFYNIVQYGVEKDTGLIDMDKVRKLAEAEKPQVIISGATAYPRLFDFKEFHSIAESVGAYSIADISHIAGLVAGGAHPSPFPFTDVVTTTTHKTLRGPRSAMIMSKSEDQLASIEGLNEKDAARAKSLSGKIDRAVFPGMQGGPHEHIIAAKAVCFGEALKPEFSKYAHQIVKNAKALSENLMSEGINLVSDGTDNHLMLIDLIKTKSVGKMGMGKVGAVALEEAGIITNCNTVPYDPSTPFRPSGIRLGTPILTTIGMKEAEMETVGEYIAKVLNNLNDGSIRAKIKELVKELCGLFRFY